MSRFYVQNEPWARFPKKLIMRRKNDDGSETERKYVPDRGIDEVESLVKDLWSCSCKSSCVGCDGWNRGGGCSFDFAERMQELGIEVW